MKNEKILIFGDSYSTFKGYIPEGHAFYYPKEEDQWGVTDVSKTWWKMLETETESEIVLNNSWSGSTISNIGYSGDCSKTSSFMFRLSTLIEQGFFAQNELDRVFIFGATNDSWIDNPCGKIMYEGWTAEDLNHALPAICWFINKLLTVVPNQKLCYIVNTGLRDEIRNGIIEICEHFGVKHIELNDIDKIQGHPTYQGMLQIKNQVLKNL